MTHFRGRVAAWDVVNEALNDDGTRRNCLWKRVIGDDWVDQAFRFARRADPGAKLFYNETKADVPNPKYEATVGLVRDLRARGVPVDGVGLQFHLTDTMPTRAQVEEAIARLGELGVDVHISEMDVPVWYLGSTLERKLARQAAVYRAVAAACNAQPACVPHHDLGVHGPLHLAPALGARACRCHSTPSTGRSRRGLRSRRRCTRQAASSSTAAPSDARAVNPGGGVANPAAARSRATQRAASVAAGPEPLKLSARLRRQRLRTWLARRALAVLVQVERRADCGSRARRACPRSRDRPRGCCSSWVGSLTRSGSHSRAAGGRRLRDVGRARVVLDGNRDRCRRPPLERRQPDPPRLMRGRVPAIALIVSAIAVAACGDGNGNEQPADRPAVKEQRRTRGGLRRRRSRSGRGRAESPAQDKGHGPVGVPMLGRGAAWRGHSGRPSPDRNRRTPSATIAPRATTPASRRTRPTSTART